MTAAVPTGPIASAVDAANAGDVDAFLACFTSGGAVDDWGRVFAGPDAIRGWSDREFIGKQVSLQVEDVTQDGLVVVVLAQVGGNGFNGPSHFTFTTAGDLLTRMTIRA